MRPDQPALAPPDVLRAAADTADDAICRRLGHNQVIALVADAVWRLAYERGHAQGHRQAAAAVQRPDAAAYQRGLAEGSDGDGTAAYATGRADGQRAAEHDLERLRAEVERLQALLDHAEQYARDLQDEAGWTRVEEWGVRVVDLHPRRKEKAGDIIRLAEETARHGPSIWAGWTTVRREVLTSEWEATDA